MNARVKLDENLPEAGAAVFESAGFDASSVLAQSLGGADDPSVFERCRREGRVLVTLDLDFADIRTYPVGSHSGIIVLRLKRQDREVILSVLASVARCLRNEPIDGRLWIADELGLRIRYGNQ